MTDVRYGLNELDTRSAFAPEKTTGFTDSVVSNLRTSWWAQAGRSLARQGMAEQPGYDPFPDMKGYEDYAADLAEARSPMQMEAMKRQIDDNLRDQEKLANSGYYWTSMFAAGVVDPANIVPVPVLKGVGFVKGALKGGASIGAISLGTEVVRQGSDPTASPQDIPGAVGFGMLFGSTLGALAGGKLDQKAMTAVRTGVRNVLEAPHRDFYGDGVARSLKSGDIGVEIVDGDAGDLDLRIEDVMDGVAADGAPSGKLVRRATVNEARIKAQFDSQPWVAMGLEPDAIKTPEEWLTFRVLLEVNRKAAGAAAPADGPPPGFVRLYRGESDFDPFMAVPGQVRGGYWSETPTIASRYGSNIYQIDVPVNDPAIASRSKPVNSGTAEDTIAEWRVDPAYANAKRKPAAVTNPPGAPAAAPDGEEGTAFWGSQIGPLSNRVLGEDEPAKPRFSVNSKSWAGEWNTFEFSTYEDYIDGVPEAMRDRRVTDEASFAKRRMADVKSVFDRSLHNVASDLLADGVTLTGQQNRNGYNGVTYWDPVSREEFFLSAQAHAFMKTLPPERFSLVQQTLDRIFPDRVDPKHTATLTSELTDETPSPFVLEAYGLTEEQYRKAFENGARTLGRVRGDIVTDSATGKYYGMALVRVALNRNTDTEIVGTAWHEALHALKASGRFTPEEWDTLVMTAHERGWHTAFGASKLDNEEAVAWAVGTWAQDRLDPRVAELPPPAKTIIERIVTFFAELKAKLLGLSKEEQLTFEKIMAMIDSGEIGRRAPRQFDSYGEAEVALRLQQSMPETQGSTNASVQRDSMGGVPREAETQLVKDTFEELRALRTSYSYSPAYGLEKLWSERISPMGRAIGEFRDDPETTALPLRIAGDSSVMSRAHQAGATLPASVLVKSQEHHGRFFGFRQAFDHHYLRAVKGPNVAPGINTLGQNMSAAVTGWGQRFAKLRGRQSLTTHDFNEMVGQAVIHGRDPVKLRELIPDDHVRAEAQAVAAKHQELMQFYEAELRRVGLDSESVNIEREAAWLQSRKASKEALIAEVRSNTSRGTLSQAQSELIRRLTDEVGAIDQKLADVPEILRQMKETPRTPPKNEPYFSRFWAIDKVQKNREGFTSLIASYYERTGNPDTARARAERTVATILDEMPDEVASATTIKGSPSPMHLKGRELDIPNTYEWNGTKVTDFIETGALDVTEAYIRRMAPYIETARMFGGDRTMQKELERISDHIMKKYVVRDGEVDLDQLAKHDAYLENVRDTRDRVMGWFHQRSPWALDNRAAGVIRNLTMLSQMGGAAVTSLVDVARIPMAYGFSTAFRAPLGLLLGDLEAVRPNLRFANEHGIALEMVNATTAGRVVEESGVQFGYGGSTAEQWLKNRIPGFFKLNLLSQLTVVTKQWANLVGQHHILRAVKAVTDGSADQQDVEWLASLGISKRDARMMARMPSQTTPSGEMNLPAVMDWPDDVDGMRARQLLASALHQQVNRVIITPSVGDLPNLSAGVVRVGGEKYESQMFGLISQFQSFGLSAANRMMVSGLQGRERSLAFGVLLAISLGMVVDYIKSPDYAWSKKSLLDKAVRGYEISGVGGWLFSDLPQMVEVATGGRLGLRPALGLPPPYGASRMDAPWEPLVGPGLGQFAETMAAFTDPEIANTQRALLVKQLVPYNNLLFWNKALRRMVSSGVQAVEQPANE